MLAFCGRYCWINQYWRKNFRLFSLTLTFSFSARSSVAVLCGAAAAFFFNSPSFFSCLAHKRWMEELVPNKQTNGNIQNDELFLHTPPKWIHESCEWVWSKIQMLACVRTRSMVFLPCLTEYVCACVCVWVVLGWNVVSNLIVAVYFIHLLRVDNDFLGNLSIENYVWRETRLLKMRRKKHTKFVCWTEKVKRALIACRVYWMQ